MKRADLRTPLGRVRGLGSARDGTSHFLWERLTALVLIPLTIWFLYSLLHTAIASDTDALALWLSSGVNATLTILLLLALFYHTKLGVQMIVEDYVHAPFWKWSALLLNGALIFGLCAASVVAVLKLHLAVGTAG